MPISLERFNRLIEAAETYLRRDKILRDKVAHSCALVASGRMTPEAAIDDISLHLKVTPHYLPAEAVIIEERTRFQLTYKRSLYERHRAAARRAGIPPTPPAQFNSPAPANRQLLPSEPPTQITPRIQAVINDLNQEADDLDEWARAGDPPPNEPTLTIDEQEDQLYKSRPKHDQEAYDRTPAGQARLKRLGLI